MKIRDAIAMASNVVARSSTVPILSHLLITPGRCVATDDTQQISLPVDIPGDVGALGFCVHAPRLLRVLKSLPESDELAFSVAEGNQLVIEAGATRFKLHTLPAADFPAMTRIEEFGVPATATIDGKSLAAALKFVAPAMAKKDIRYYLCGVSITIHNGKMTLAASDGHRAHRIRIDAEETSGEPTTGIVHSSCVPRVIEMAEKSSTLEIEITSNVNHHNRMTLCSDKTLDIKLINGQFPDLTRVIPSQRTVTGSVSRTGLAAAAQRVAQVYISEAFQRVDLTFAQGGISLAATNAEGDSGSTVQAWSIVDDKLDAPGLPIDAPLLIEALQAFSGDEVFLHLPPNATDSLYITDNNDGSRQVVIMPMRL